jgi:hypothetical protein
MKIIDAPRIAHSDLAVHEIWVTGSLSIEMRGGTETIQLVVTKHRPESRGKINPTTVPPVPFDSNVRFRAMAQGLEIRWRLNENHQLIGPWIKLGAE